jgi:hypothetical protein
MRTSAVWIALVAGLLPGCGWSGRPAAPDEPPVARAHPQFPPAPHGAAKPQVRIGLGALADDDRPAPAPVPPPATVSKTWAVGPDPAPLQVAGPFDLTTSIPVPPLADVIYPTAPSPFVAVTSGSQGPGALRVYDLRTMKPLGEPIPVRFDVYSYFHTTLSPDGAFFAAVPKTALFNPQEKTTVHVWSVATGRQVHRLPVDRDPKVRAGLVEFAGPDRLLVMSHPSPSPKPGVKVTYTLWDLEKGQPVTQFWEDWAFHWKWGGFSPGHKYMVLADADACRLSVFELAPGRRAGDFAFQNRDAAEGQVAGICFAPDGTEIALLWRLGRQADLWGRLRVWDVATRQKRFDHPIGHGLKSIDALWAEGGPRTIQWWPARNGWLLFGHLLVDRESGAVVGKVGPEPHAPAEVARRRFLDGDHVTTIESAADTAEKRLKVIALPRTEIDAAVQKARIRI